MAPHLQLARAPAGDRQRAAPPHAIRVVLADDHAMVRRALKQLMAGEPDLNVVAEACDLGAAFHHLNRHAPHVVVLDLQMPGGSSVETIRRLRECSPDTEIVVVTMERSPAFARTVLQGGAAGFVLKDTADAELVAAVRSAARGERFVSPRVGSAIDGLVAATGA